MAARQDGPPVRIRYLRYTEFCSWCQSMEDDYERFATEFGDKQDGYLCVYCRKDPKARAEFEKGEEK